ncbi:c-type cytochrome [Variovorax ureilyticus]|uniref:C-type cytochrome n=1 Tax=Variovorax ureilyticus TaxID=1836198 RepID=A0ABU8VM20_9BURK
MSTSSLAFLAQTLLAGALLAAQGAASAQDKSPDAEQAARKVAGSICASCHGPGGVSTSPVFPRLAGQQELYLVAQLKAFKSKTRGEQDAHDYMWAWPPCSKTP